MQVDNKEKIEKLTGVKVVATVKKDEKDIIFNEIATSHFSNAPRNDSIKNIFKEIK